MRASPSPASGQGLCSANCRASATSAATLGVDRLQARLVGDADLDQQSLPQRAIGQRCLPLLDLFARAVGEVAHAFGVRARAIGLAFDQRRPVAGARPAHRLAGDLVNGQHVVAVDLDAGHAVAAPRGGRRSGLPLAYANGTSVANWLFSQTNSTGSFQMLAMFSPSWNAPLLTAPSPKNATADAVGLQQLEAVAAAAGLQDARPDDAAGAHHADLGREQVHAAAAPARAAGRAAEQFGHQLAAAASPWPARGRVRDAC